MNFSRSEAVLLPIPFTDLTSLSLIMTIEFRLLIKTVGRLSIKDQAALEQQLRVWLQL